MKTICLTVVTLFLVFTGALPISNAAEEEVQPAPSVDEQESLDQRDAYWAEVSRCVKAGDFEGYAATCHHDGVLVSGTKSTSSPLATALDRWKPEFINTKAGKLNAAVEFRFSRRVGDATTAHETGMFRYSSGEAGAEMKDEHIHFEALLVKRDGRWKILMENQKSVGTKEEWDALAADH